jgi:hypothetical protein
VKKGQAVYILSGSSALPNIALGDNTSSTKCRVVGIAAADASSGTVLIRRAGTLTNVDTRTTNTYVNPNGETWAEGDLLFLTTSGGLTKTRPTSGRSVKVAYSLKGNSATDTLLSYPFENPVWSTCASGENCVLRLGDNSGTNKVSIRDYANNEQAYINSDGLIYASTGVNIASGQKYKINNVDLAASDVGGIAAPASPEQGDILYYNGSAYVVLHHGTDGQALITKGHAANPEWGTVSGGSGGDSVMEWLGV